LSHARPPLLARVLLNALLPDDLHEAVAGDLEERFRAKASADLGAARRAYWRDVLSPSLLELRRETRGMPLTPGASPRSGRGDGPMRSLLSDLKFAVRTLSKSPGFTAVAVLSLALGIGPNTAIFSLVNAVLYQGWGVGEPESLIDIYTLTDDGQYFFNSYDSFELIEEGASDVFERVTNQSLLTARLEGSSGETEMVLGEMVSGTYFDVMRVDAALGRTLAPDDDADDGARPVVVLGHHYWESRYGADPSIVGSEIRMNGRPYTVVGVAPDTFKGRLAPGIGTDFWVPLQTYPHLNPSKLNNGDFTISARVRDGVTPGQALAAVQTLAAREDSERQARNPDRRSRFQLIGVQLSEVRLHPGVDGVLTQMAILLFVAVGLVLLVACVNLAGFLLSRAQDRRKEMAVRVAMGAGRGAILRQLVVESLVLASLGAVLGLGLGQLAVRALVSVEPPLPIPVELEVGLNMPVLVFTAIAAAVAAVVFGLTPALESTRAPVAATLRDEAGSSGGRRKVGARGVLVASQMALSTVLLFGAVLFARSLQAATEMDLGFGTRVAAVVGIDTSPAEYAPEEQEVFNEELLRRLSAQPAVASIALTNRMPLALGVSNIQFDVPGIEPPPNQNRHVLETTRVSEAYFETLGIELIEGRVFTDADRTGSAPVVVLSKAAADRYWPGQSAVGRTLLPNADGSDALTVVGVVGNAKIWSLSEAPFPYLYRPMAQASAAASYTVVATGSAPPGELASMVRAEALAIDGRVFMTEVGTMDDHLGYVYFLPRMAAVVLSMIGLLALLLACIGLYGMVSYNVSRRTREMGIRLALGADRQRVVSLVLRGGLVLIGVGAAVGIAGSLGLGSLLGSASFLLGVGALDPLALLAAPALLSLIAGVATYLPARRAARVDPVRALRSE
jgi:predicted permease